ncbi:MAG: HNH endonuclease [Balneolaceae bacterium]
MKKSATEAINRYLSHCKKSQWVHDEAYKFQFANYIYQNVEWENQSDSEILGVLKQSQKMRYTGNVLGIQFILRSAREKMSEYIGIEDVSNFRQIHEGARIDQIDWDDRNTSYTGMSAWLGALFPKRFYPIPATTLRESILYLFDKKRDIFPKNGLSYIVTCQSYMEETEKELKKYPIEELFLPELNKFYEENPDLKISLKHQFDKIDWGWVVQDFHLFVHREVLGLYKQKVTKDDIQDEYVDEIVEGKSVLAIHKRYERNGSLIKKVKEQRLKDEPFLQCDVCGFSFMDTYGDIGKGFIEAHHLNPLGERDGEQVTKSDDIALVCSNCHKMLHKGDPVFELEVLKKLIDDSRK